MDSTLVLILGLMLVGGIVQSAVGFGVGVVAGPFLAILRPELVPTGLILPGMALSLLILVRDLRHVHWPGLGWTLLGRGPGIVAGTLIVLVAPAPVIGVILAISILGTVAINWSKPRIRLNRPNLVLAGAAAGLTGTSAGIGGPPLALVYQNEEPARTRATLSAFFTVGGVGSLAALWWTHAIPLGVMRESFLIAPAPLIGYVFAQPLVKRLSRQRMRVVILTIAGLVSSLLLIRSIWTLL